METTTDADALLKAAEPLVHQHARVVKVSL
jgi:hypothetical protein